MGTDNTSRDVNGVGCSAVTVVSWYSVAPVSGCVKLDPLATTFANCSGLSTNRFFKSCSSRNSTCLLRFVCANSEVLSVSVVCTKALSSDPKRPRLLFMKLALDSSSLENFSCNDCFNNGSFLNKRWRVELSLLHVLHRTVYFD